MKIYKTISIQINSWNQSIIDTRILIKKEDLMCRGNKFRMASARSMTELSSFQVCLSMAACELCQRVICKASANPLSSATRTDMQFIAVNFVRVSLSGLTKLLQALASWALLALTSKLAAKCFVLS